ncbi:MAG: hypothetical protein H7Y04_07420 [Verrucomicrobia bacterium]|nr:hypothetical protein [Cytophagales bacterium]
MTTTFAIVIVFVAGMAFYTNLKGILALRNLHLLTPNFWKEQGSQTIGLGLLWLALLTGGAGLLFETAWAKNLLQITFWVLLASIWIVGLWRNLRMLRIMRQETAPPSQMSKFNFEILQKLGVSFQELLTLSEKNIAEDDADEVANEEVSWKHLEKGHLRKKIIASFITMFLASGVVILGISVVRNL